MMEINLAHLPKNTRHEVVLFLLLLPSAERTLDQTVFIVLDKVLQKYHSNWHLANTAWDNTFTESENINNFWNKWKEIFMFYGNK